MRQRNVWFISDPHIGHRLVARLRGFTDSSVFEEHRGETVPTANTEAHDVELARNWDSAIHEDDLVYVMGDISINGSQNALDWMKSRPGIKILVSGNHDPIHPGFFRNGFKKVEPWRAVFVDIQPYFRLSINGQQVLLCHLPYSGTGAEGKRDNGEEVEERGAQWRLPDLGLPLIHGHTHGDEKDHLSDRGTPQLHVGLDAWELKPVPKSEVIKWLEAHKNK